MKRERDMERGFQKIRKKNRDKPRKKVATQGIRHRNNRRHSGIEQK